jgi:hypothetical protein
MFKGRFLDALKGKGQNAKDNDEISQAATGNQKQKRSSSEEFLKGYEALWRSGPMAKYDNALHDPREMQSTNP